MSINYIYLKVTSSVSWMFRKGFCPSQLLENNSAQVGLTDSHVLNYCELDILVCILLNYISKNMISND